VVAPSSAAACDPRGDSRRAGRAPFWPRSRGPSLEQSAAVAARLGEGLPPATLDPPGGELVDVDPGGPPVCPSCHRRHETPGELRPPAMARALDLSAGRVDPRQQRLPGWGRDRGRCS
jgi:hypothetical protein